MYILLTGFIILNIFFSFIDYVVVGASDMYVTKLTSAISANTTTVPVQSTAGWRTADWAMIDDEKLRYNGKTSTSFNNAVRGYDATDAVAHASGSRVYGRMSDVLNTSVGFNIIDTGASVGAINTISMVTRFVTTALPQMVQWNFYFLKEGFWQYLRMLLVAMSAALVFVIAIQLLSALGGLLRSAFTRT